MAKDINISSLEIAFRWSGLKKRRLVSTENSINNLITLGSKISEDEENVSPNINIPLNIHVTAIYQFVHKAIESLFHRFNGYEISEQEIENILKKSLNNYLTI